MHWCEWCEKHMLWIGTQHFELRLKHMKRYKEALCDKVPCGKFSGFGTIFQSTCCWKEQLQSGPKHCMITSPRQCILLILLSLLSVKSHSIILWWLNSGTEPDIPKRKWLTSQQCLGNGQTGLLKTVFMSVVWNTCVIMFSCVVFPRLCACLSRTTGCVEAYIIQCCSKIF